MDKRHPCHTQFTVVMEQINKSTPYKNENWKYGRAIKMSHETEDEYLERQVEEKVQYELDCWYDDRHQEWMEEQMNRNN